SATGPRCAMRPARWPRSPAPPRTSRWPTCCPASMPARRAGRWCSRTATWPGSCPRQISAVPWSGSAATLARVGGQRPGVWETERLHVRRPVAETAVPGRLTWQAADVIGVATETPRVKTIAFDVPNWPGHRAGQHVDVRLTAEDGYQTERSYS